jgi:hypothetical protein
MFKRLLVVGFLTGFAHLINIVVLKLLSVRVSTNSLSDIGEIDSLVILIIGFVSFGIQLSATRKLALMKDWEKEYYDTQSARFTLSLFLCLFCVTGFIITKNFLFLIAPVFALNADYALYGRGMPKSGALVSFVRVLIPSLSLLIAVFFFLDSIVIIYIVSIFFAYLIGGLMVSQILKVPYFVKPKVANLKKYLTHIDIGIAGIFYLFIGVGLINIISFFYSDPVIAVIYLLLKIYIIFRGVRQIIVQSFFKELSNEKIALKVDYFSLLGGVVFFVTLAVFPNLFTQIFLNPEFLIYYKSIFILALAGFISSFTTSTGARLLLMGKDKEYSRNIIFAGSISILSSIVFYLTFGDKPHMVAFSILLGELALSALDIFALKEKGFLLKRIKYIFPLLLVVIAVLFVKPYISNELLAYIGFLILSGLAVILFRRKWFETS